MEHTRAKYVAQLEWAVKPDRHWVDEDTVAQINGRLIHSASVHVDIILEMGPLFRWQHHRLHLDNPKLRHRDKHALRSLQLILAIMTANAWQPIFPPVRRPLIDGLSSTIRIDDPPVRRTQAWPGRGHPRRGVLYRILDLLPGRRNPVRHRRADDDGAGSADPCARVPRYPLVL